MLLFAPGGTSGRPRCATVAKREGSTCRFGRFAPGTYAVSIDVPGSAPVLLHDVRLAEGETTLDPVALTRGA